jgi:hypothetical protein
MLKKSLAETHPEVAKQWHPTKNKNLTVYDFISGSIKKVWWKCNKGDDHEWEANIRERCRSKRKSCPICSGKKLVPSNRLAILNPEVAKQWHPTKNGDLTPFDFTTSYNKKVWWKCDKGDDHEYEMTITNKTKQKQGCPICSGRKVALSNCLATINPDVAKEWHPTKNGELTPFDFTSSSDKKVWWQCPEGDEHEWEASLNSRARGRGCPVCAGRKVVLSNCLATINPDVAKEWHPTKNGELTPFDFVTYSSKKVWWKCDKGDDHEYEMTISSKTFQNQGCPICYGQRVVLSNCLATINPDVAKEWHPTKNGELTPFDFTPSSNKKVWWQCPEGDDHEWKTSLDKRTRGRGCPVCDGKKVVLSNCLATIYPDVAKEWHPTKNGELTPFKITSMSKKKIWWQCDKGDDHKWRTSVGNRILHQSGCPFCTLTPQSKQELTITFELLKLFKNIDPKGLKTKLDGSLRAIDIFIPKLNLCIEFDGSYWHKDRRDIDKIKSEMLFEEGFKLIRVCEEPLEKLYETDVISKQPYNGKQVTNDILSMIMSIFELDAKLVSKIKEYQSKEGLQNEKGLEKYIDKILTEKAEKK